jgi:hypothetical protein
LAEICDVVTEGRREQEDASRAAQQPIDEVCQEAS